MSRYNRWSARNERRLTMPMRMSAFGPKRTSLVAPHMSAFGGEADIDQPPFTAAAITVWRETLDARDRRGLKHPLSNVRRWRQSLAPKEVTEIEGATEATATQFTIVLQPEPHIDAIRNLRIAHVTGCA